MAKSKKSGSSILKFDTVKAQARAANRDGKSLLEIEVEQRFVPPGLIEKIEQTTFAVPVLLTINRPDQSPLKIGSRDYVDYVPIVETTAVQWAQQNVWSLRMQYPRQKGLLLLDFKLEYTDFLPLKDWVVSSPVPMIRAIQEATGVEGIEQIQEIIKDLSSMEIGCFNIEWTEEMPFGEIRVYHYMDVQEKQTVLVRQMRREADAFSHVFPIVYVKPELTQPPDRLDERYGMASIPEWVSVMLEVWEKDRPDDLSDETDFDFCAFAADYYKE